MSTMYLCESNRKVKKVLYMDVSCSDFIWVGTHRANESNILQNVDSLRQNIRNYEASVSGVTPLTEAQIAAAMSN